MNKWVAIVVFDLMILTAAVGMKAAITHAAQTNAETAVTSKIIGAPLPQSRIIGAPLPQSGIIGAPLPQ